MGLITTIQNKTEQARAKERIRPLLESRMMRDILLEIGQRGTEKLDPQSVPLDQRPLASKRAAELLQLEQLAAELQQRSEEMQTQLLRTPRIVGPRRMLRAYPKLRHGSKLRSLPTLREMLRRAEQENKDDNKNTK